MYRLERERRVKEEMEQWRYNEFQIAKRSVENKEKFKQLSERNQRIYEFYS